MQIINQALKVASDNLRACYGKHGIYAGLHHFKDYWARDSFFASYGSLAKEDYDIVRQNLDLFLKNINSQGQIPLRIGKSGLGIVLSYYGFAKYGKRKPIYDTDKTGKKTVDQNSLFIILLYEYYKATKDKNFLIKNIEKIEKVIQWNFLNDKDKDYLIEESKYCNWADSIRKKGKVLYTNVCHCHGLYCMSKIYEKIDITKSRKYLDLHKKVKNKINELFWSGEHYLDWIDGKKRYNYFSTDGNILAILWNIASKEKARYIEEASHIFDVNEIPSQCVHPNYPNKYVSLQIRLLGLGDYHNGLSWLWLGCINAIAKNKIGMKKDAVSLLRKISLLITKYRHVYEVYDKSGKPVKRLIYRAEYPFAWSSGLFIYAVKEILG